MMRYWSSRAIHGENFWEHDVESFFQHAAWVYQTTVHSVGMIRLPDASNGGTRS